MCFSKIARFIQHLTFVKDYSQRRTHIATLYTFPLKYTKQPFCDIVFKEFGNIIVYNPDHLVQAYHSPSHKEKIDPN